jgi:transposase-like protein
VPKRKQHHPEFKAKAALEALKGEETFGEFSDRFGVQVTLTEVTATQAARPK